MLDIGQIYLNDDLFFLHMPWRLGLAAISLVMAIRMTAFVRWSLNKSQISNENQFSDKSWASKRFAKIKGWPLPALGLLSGLISYWLFVWISPQFYYFYYMAMFSDLPLQAEIGWPPSPFAIVKLLTFKATWSIADHASGLLGWFLILRGLYLADDLEKADRNALLTEVDGSV